MLDDVDAVVVVAGDGGLTLLLLIYVVCSCYSIVIFAIDLYQYSLSDTCCWLAAADAPATTPGSFYTHTPTTNGQVEIISRTLPVNTLITICIFISRSSIQIKWPLSFYTLLLIAAAACLSLSAPECATYLLLLFG